MTTDSGAVPGSSLDAREAAAAAETRPLYWSVRRELWENRSIYVAPLAAAAVVIFGSSIHALGLPHRMRNLSALDPAQQRLAIITPFSTAAMLIMFTAFVVAVFYSLDALHGERRDRSILFWKSLPVSDLTTVLAKASIPVLVMPPLIAAIVLATQVVMLLVSTFVLLASGTGAATLWSQLPFVQMSVIQLYGLAVHALWHAPIYAWLLLVSAWARRTPFLWAVLPVMAIGGFERIAIGTSYVCAFLRHRFMGAFEQAFTVDAHSGHLVTRITQLDPLRFLTSSGLWFGLAVAALFLAAATRLRRYRGPI
jgi:ABC-2 type transport system permease protein